MPLGRSEDATGLIRNACLRLETMAMQFFAFRGLEIYKQDCVVTKPYFLLVLSLCFLGVYPLLRFGGLSLLSAQSALLLVL